MSDVRDGLDIVPVPQLQRQSVAAVIGYRPLHAAGLGRFGDGSLLHFLVSFSRYRNRERVLTTTKKTQIMIRIFFFFFSASTVVCTRT